MKPLLLFLLLVPTVHLFVVKYALVHVNDNTTAMGILPAKSALECVILCSAKTTCAVVEFIDGPPNLCHELNYSLMNSSTPTKHVHLNMLKGRH